MTDKTDFKPCLITNPIINPIMKYGPITINAKFVESIILEDLNVYIVANGKTYTLEYPLLTIAELAYKNFVHILKYGRTLEEDNITTGLHSKSKTP
jgi:hypothetical protein